MAIKAWEVQLEDQFAMGKKTRIPRLLFVSILATLVGVLTIMCSSCNVHLTSRNISYNAKAADYLQKASELEAKKEYGKAIPLVDEAIKLDSKYYSAYKLRGHLYEELGDKIGASGAASDEVNANYQKGIDDYKMAIKLDSSPDVLNRYSIASVYIKMKQYDEARRYVNEMLKIHPGDGLAQNLLKEIDEKSKGSL